MAICKDGALVSSVSGKLGSIVIYQGARRNVIAKAPTQTPTTSPEVQARHAALRKLQGRWQSTTEANRQAWTVFARSLPWSNRLGIRRPLTGYQACLSYYLQIDPHQAASAALSYPPLNVSTTTPIIDSVAFDHDGDCDVITTATPPANCFEYLYLRTLLQYGPRTAPGQTNFIGAKSATTDTVEWSAEIAARGINFAAGDELEIRIYWVSTAKWPSLRDSTTTIAT